MYAGNFDEARRRVRAALIARAGSPVGAAEELRVSIPFMQYVIKRLGMKGEPAKIRGIFKNRYRLPPLAAP
jgi:hypothetical protein